MNLKTRTKDSSLKAKARTKTPVLYLRTTKDQGQGQHACIMGHFGDKSFPTITCTGTAKLPTQNKQQKMKKKTMDEDDE